MRGTTNRVALALWVALSVTGCGGSSDPGEPAPGGPRPPADSRVPLMDMGTGTYLGFQGGLYPDGSNSPPSAHDAEGRARAKLIAPIEGNSSAGGTDRIVLLSIGMSNTTQEFCSAGPGTACASWSFVGQALADGAVNNAMLEFVDGAAGGKTAAFWDSPADPDYDRVRDTRLAPRGLNEEQVQVVWVKVANPSPTTSLPDANADAYRLVTQMGNIARSLKARYQNVRQVFFSNRIYAGYATTALNPEPYAYESGFAVKWVVQAQIDQMRTGAVDPRAGNLDYSGVPWIAWGPDLWANGTTPRSDGLTYVRADLESDGTHPSRSGEEKVGRRLLDFFKASPYTSCWFLVAGNCPG
ncbi:hypothetical protein BH23GEM1_BH23GEM1_10130 [soil metagenome]